MRITPSILNADFAHLGEEIGRIPSADAIHIDVMDNHFVPNLTFGLPIVNSVRAVTDRMLDIHLMIDDPDRCAPLYGEAGAESVTFHIEAAQSPVRLARQLRKTGVRAGVALNPTTPPEVVIPILTEVDMVLVMTVEPGFGGQPFLDLCLPKITELRQRIDASGRDIWLQVDGGICAETIERCAQAGADTFVAGWAVFHSDEPDQMVRRLRASVEAVAAGRGAGADQ